MQLQVNARILGHRVMGLAVLAANMMTNLPSELFSLRCVEDGLLSKEAFVDS